MTKLTKPVTRELGEVGTTRPLLVTLAPEGIVFRTKGTRTRYTLPYGTALLKAIAIEANFDTTPRRRKRRSA